MSYFQSTKGTETDTAASEHQTTQRPSCVIKTMT